MNVIVATDNPLTKQGLGLYLNFLTTKTCEEVSDGPTLVDRIQTGDYSFALVEHEMPGMDGLEAVRQIRRYNDAVPVYVMSRLPIEEQSVEAGATGFILKTSDFAQQLRQVLYDNFDR